MENRAAYKSSSEVLKVLNRYTVIKFPFSYHPAAWWKKGWKLVRLENREAGCSNIGKRQF